MNSILNITTDLGVWLGEELEVVSNIISDHLHNKHGAVNEVCLELAAYRGKMLRPSLVLLSWNAVSKENKPPQSVRIAAAVVELIHLATLVHDDVLDEADMRRGKQTMNSLLGNEAAVMLGDYLLSGAFYLCSTIKNPSLNMLLGEVTNMVCAGELMQLSHRNNLDLTLEEYYQIINDKTASLISASCVMGGMLGGATKIAVHSLQTFGDFVGVAFQIRDDLIDILGDADRIGKPVGRDVQKGKLTLPIISMLQQHPSKRAVVIEAIANNNVSALCELPELSQSIQTSRSEVNRLVVEAVCALRVNIDTDASEQLCLLAEQLMLPV